MSLAIGTRIGRVLGAALMGAVLLALPAAGQASAPAASSVDLSVWRHIPVFNKGRVKPMDTFANLAMDSICNQAKGKIRLGVEDYLTAEQLADSRYAGLRELFPEGRSRSFTSAELVLSWVLEPDKWEDVPFIYAPHGELRKVLEGDVKNLGMKYVSPRQVAQSQGLLEHLRDMRDRQTVAQTAGDKFQPTPLDELVQKLLERYSHYRSITFDPRQRLTHSPVMQAGSRANFMRQFDSFLDLAQKQNPQGNTLYGTLDVLARAPDSQLSRSAQQTRGALAEVAEVGQPLFLQWRAAVEGGAAADDMGGDVTLDTARQAVQRLQQAAGQLQEQLEEQKLTVYSSEQLDAAQRQSLGPIFRELASKSRELKRLAYEMHVALFDEGNGLMVVPALNAPSLAKTRDTSNTSQPWLSLRAVLHADELLEGYPEPQIRAVRAAWEQLQQSYTDRQAADRRQACLDAQQRLARALRELGQAVEPLRQKLVAQQLPPEERDEDLIDYTRYPYQEAAVGRMAAEVHYNSVDPFKWSWIIGLVTLVFFSLSFGVIRKPMFWAAVAVLLLGLAWTAYGFYLRVLITQWAPVTNMYETVVFVPWVVSLLGAWLLLLPLNWPGLRDAWRAAAVPGTWEATPLSDEQQEKLSPGAWNLLGAMQCVPRVGLMSLVLYIMSIAPYADGGRPVFRLLPNLEVTQGSMGGLLNNLIVWAVGLVCLGLSMWFLPRLVLAGVNSLVFIPWNWKRSENTRKLTQEVYGRWVIGFAATLAATFGAWVAWYAPNDVLNENFSPLQPVLRSNFWLTVHVLTIVASYGAGFLALMLGNLALGYYLFGRYRNPAKPAKVAEGMQPAASDAASPTQRRRPPEQCSQLAHYAYKSVQVAVLLLAAGTILGGLWADVSWGRFWGWDPKEVWALVSLLVYLAILHGRFAGWFNNFGLTFGTVAGATMIMMSWYGVNFVLPMLADSGSVGLHSYGSGSGGVQYVAGFVAANWVFLGLATVRYFKEVGTAVTPEA